VVILVTCAEKVVLDTVAFIEYGELRNIDVPLDEPEFEYEVSEYNKQFIQHLRDCGYTNRAIVHQGNVTSVELEGTFKTISYTKKIKFQ
jgi:hypothetical protein